MKVEIGIVEAALKKHDIEPPIVAEILSDLKSETEETEKAPPIKKQYVIVISDPQNRVPEGLVGWAVQIEEGKHVSKALETLYDCAALYNNTPKGHRLPVDSVGLAMEVLPPKITKEAGLWIKTREPVYVVTTDNVLKPGGISAEAV